MLILQDFELAHKVVTPRHFGVIDFQRLLLVRVLDGFREQQLGLSQSLGMLLLLVTPTFLNLVAGRTRYLGFAFLLNLVVRLGVRVSPFEESVDCITHAIMIDGNDLLILGLSFLSLHHLQAIRPKIPNRILSSQFMHQFRYFFFL